MRALALLLLALASGMDVPLDHRQIEDALTIANSSLESTHRRFHADYRFAVNTAPVDFVSLVTPFRRVVLGAETAERLGHRMFGQREALAALRPDPDRLELYGELTFHPLNTFVAVPDYTIELESAGARAPRIPALGVDRIPRFGPRTEEPWYPFPYPYSVGPRLPSAGQPLVGGTLIARFSVEQVDPKSVYVVLILDGKKELARARVDLLRLR